jgi:4-hydroxy-4-methyl-2-oxoglutarate aldolase
MSIANEIIAFCKKNRVSTTEAADALGKNGVFKGLNTLNNGKYEVGSIFCVFASNGSNYDVHDQIKEVKEGDIVMIFTENCNEKAIFGALVAKFILLYKGAAAIVVEGKVRDAAELKRENYSIWCEGVTPLGCHNQSVQGYNEARKVELLKEFHRAIAICDEGGVTVIANQFINDDMLEKLKLIEMQEDIWQFCLDSLKWDTKKIVCDKEYLTETDDLPKKHVENLAKLKIELDKIKN